MPCPVQVDGKSKIDVFALGIDVWLHIGRDSIPELLTVVSTRAVVTNITLQLALRQSFQDGFGQTKVRSDQIHVTKKDKKKKYKEKKIK
jgi:hypothetical protein